MYELLKDLNIVPTPYAPTLNYRPDGRYRYERVPNYNSVWLKRDKQGELKKPEDCKSFEPSAVWTEDRWTFVRRMVGDEFAQKLFYKVCAFIWTVNGVPKGREMQQYQDAVIEDVFHWRDKMDFVRKEKEPTEVSTWDGQTYGYISHSYLEKLATQISCLGPIAGLFGRDVEQEIMALRTNYLSMVKFEHSVTISKCAIRKSAMNEYEKEDD